MKLEPYSLTPSDCPKCGYGFVSISYVGRKDYKDHRDYPIYDPEYLQVICSNCKYCWGMRTKDDKTVDIHALNNYLKESLK